MKIDDTSLERFLKSDPDELPPETRHALFKGIRGFAESARVNGRVEGVWTGIVVSMLMVAIVNAGMVLCDVTHGWWGWWSVGVPVAFFCVGTASFGVFRDGFDKHMYGELTPKMEYDSSCPSPEPDPSSPASSGETKPRSPRPSKA